MKTGVIFVSILLVLSCCVEKRLKKDLFFINVQCVNQKTNDRNGLDYIFLWVNDTLLFSNTYYTNYIDSTRENLDDAVMGMRIATLDKANRDSLKIRIRVISLDSILFGNKRVMDSTVYYRIDNIPGITIYDSREVPEDYGSFRFIDPVKEPGCWIVD